MLWTGIGRHLLSERSWSMNKTGFTFPPRAKRPCGRAIRVFLACAWLLSVGASRADSLGDLQGLRGRVIYVDFWASWCVPCRQSFPWMQEMQEDYEHQGLTVIAVNVDRDRKDAERFLAGFRPNFAVRFDPKGETAERFKVHGMPTSVLIDRRGVVRFTHVGFRPVDRSAYEEHLRELLAEK